MDVAYQPLFVCFRTLIPVLQVLSTRLVFLDITSSISMLCRRYACGRHGGRRTQHEAVATDDDSIKQGRGYTQVAIC